VWHFQHGSKSNGKIWYYMGLDTYNIFTKEENTFTTFVKCSNEFNMLQINNFKKLNWNMNALIKNLSILIIYQNMSIHTKIDISHISKFDGFYFNIWKHILTLLFKSKNYGLSLMVCMQNPLFLWLFKLPQELYLTSHRSK
jgi:hypothetical protein